MKHVKLFGMNSIRCYQRNDMDILNFDSIRLGNFPLSFDVQKEDGHCNYGISVGFYVYQNHDNSIVRAELRKISNEYRLFLFRYNDQEVPGYWMNAEIVWCYENPHK